RHAIRVLEIPADRQAPRDSGNRQWVAGETALHIQRGGLAFDAGIRGNYHFANDSSRHPGFQLRNGEILWSDAVKRRQATPEDVIDSPVLARPFDSADIGCFLYCADDCRIPARVTADGAQILLCQVEALRAGSDLLRECAERGGETFGLLGRLLEKMVGQSERRLPPDARQL